MRLAEGVILNLIITTYPFLPFVLLWVTPAANRNSYRVARLVGSLPRVAVFARNPGLGNRNSYRVAAAYGVYPRSPSLALYKGTELSPFLQPSPCGVNLFSLCLRRLGCAPSP